jgi:hypothetical protein
MRGKKAKALRRLFTIDGATRKDLYRGFKRNRPLTDEQKNTLMRETLRIMEERGQRPRDLATLRAEAQALLSGRIDE